MANYVNIVDIFKIMKREVSKHPSMAVFPHSVPHTVSRCESTRINPPHTLSMVTLEPSRQSPYCSDLSTDLII